MRKPIYRQALINSWHLVWHNKLLWILGICSVVLTQWGLGDFIGQMNLFVDEGFALPPSFTEVANVLSVMHFDNITATFLSLWFFVLVALFAVAIIFIAVVSRGALIAITAEWFYDRERIPISAAWQDGVKSFWTVLSLTVVNKLLQTVVALGLANFLIAAFVIRSHFYGALAAVAFVVAILLVLVLESVTIYASCYAVLERVWFGQALHQGWNLFRKHKLVSLEVGLLLVLLSLIFAGVLIAGAIAVFIPFLALWFVAGVSGWYFLITVGLVLAIALFLIIGILAGGLFSAFTTSTWVYLFMKMHHEGIFSRVKHHLKNWLNVR